MKTYILSVPNETDDAAVRAALAELLAQHRIVLEPDAANVLLPLSADEFASAVQAALASPKFSADEARAYLGL